MKHKSSSKCQIFATCLVPCYCCYCCSNSKEQILIMFTKSLMISYLCSVYHVIIEWFDTTSFLLPIQSLNYYWQAFECGGTWQRTKKKKEQGTLSVLLSTVCDRSPHRLVYMWIHDVCVIKRIGLLQTNLRSIKSLVILLLP